MSLDGGDLLGLTRRLSRIAETIGHSLDRLAMAMDPCDCDRSRWGDSQQEQGAVWICHLCGRGRRPLPAEKR
jgi:hypothetical protein